MTPLDQIALSVAIGELRGGSFNRKSMAWVKLPPPPLTRAIAVDTQAAPKKQAVPKQRGHHGS